VCERERERERELKRERGEERERERERERDCFHSNFFALKRKSRLYISYLQDFFFLGSFFIFLLSSGFKGKRY
jgi:hypothetical protein